MKNEFKNKLLLLTLLSVVFVNGCASQNINVATETALQYTLKVENKQKIAKKQDENCLDCKVTLPKKSKVLSSYKTLYAKNKKVFSSSIDEKPFEYVETKDDTYQRVDVNLKPKIEKYSKKTAVQVGAFRHYTGAKVYAKKYDLLPSKYNVSIREQGSKNRTLYKVRIEGFLNEKEARKFISSYGTVGAFLVRR